MTETKDIGSTARAAKQERLKARSPKAAFDENGQMVLTKRERPISAGGVKNNSTPRPHPEKNAAPVTTGQSPAERLDYAVRHESPDTVEFLITTRGIMPTQETLLYSVKHGCLDEIKSLMTSGIIPAQETLRYAVQCKNLETVKALLVTGLVPEKKTFDFALHYISVDIANVLAEAIIAGKKPPQPAKPARLKLKKFRS